LNNWLLEEGKIGAYAKEAAAYPKVPWLPAQAAVIGKAIADKLQRRR